MADILLLVSAPPAAERVRRALQIERASGVFHALHRAQSWAELADLAGRAPVGLAFVDPYHSGPFAGAEIRRLRARFPALELIAYADFAGRPACEPFALARLGVRAVLSLGAGDDPARIRQCLADHLNQTPYEELLDRLGERVPPHLHGWLEQVMRSALVPRTAAELAVMAHCSPRTLRRTLRAAGLPPAEQLLGWRRLLHAVRLMEDTHRSVDSVARALDYSSGSALRKSLKRLTGLRPGEVIARGGLRLAGELFLAWCTAPGDGAGGRAGMAAAETGGGRSGYGIGET